MLPPGPNPGTSTTAVAAVRNSFYPPARRELRRRHFTICCPSPPSLVIIPFRRYDPRAPVALMPICRHLFLLPPNFAARCRRRYFRLRSYDRSSCMDHGWMSVILRIWVLEFIFWM